MHSIDARLRFAVLLSSTVKINKYIKRLHTINHLALPSFNDTQSPLRKPTNLLTRSASSHQPAVISFTIFDVQGFLVSKSAKSKITSFIDAITSDGFI